MIEIFKLTNWAKRFWVCSSSS